MKYKGNALDVIKPDPKGSINSIVYYLKSTIKPFVGIFSVLMYLKIQRKPQHMGTCDLR